MTEGPARSRQPALILGIVAAVLLLSGTIIVFTVNRATCLELTLWSSDEKFVQLQEVAKRYRESGRKIDDQCVSVTVAIHGSRATSDALAAAPEQPWDTPVRPDIWSPSSSIWIERLKAATKDKPGRVRTVGEVVPSLVTSPVVIAMPLPMAEALGWPGAEIGWRDLLALARDPQGWGAKGHLEWGRFKLGKTNPEESTTGLEATIATATALARNGASSTAALTKEDLPRIAADLGYLEQATVHYGRYVETFVGNLYEADQEGKALYYVSAIAMEEKVVLDYNKGIILDNPPRQDKPPKVPLAAIFPRDGTMVSDNPALIIDADWVSDTKRRAAEDFLRFVQDNRQVFIDAGFRDNEGTPGAIHLPEHGTVARPEYRPVRTPSMDVIEGVRQLWMQNRRRVNVLLVVDVSGSMKEPVGSDGPSRLELAKIAATPMPGRLAPDDRIGLWEFSSEIGLEQQPWRQLVPIGPVGQVTVEFGAKIANLRPIGQTALYATTRAAVNEMAKGYDLARINAVIILSDGKNQYAADDNLSRLLEDLRAQPIDNDHVVRVFTIAYGGDADRITLADISRATRAHSYNATDATSIEDIMLDVLSNF